MTGVFFYELDRINAMKDELIEELHKICDAAGGQHKFENCIDKALKKAKIDPGFK